MSGVELRPARVADADELARVHTQCWRDAYAGLIPAEALVERVVTPNTWVGWLTESDPRASVFVAVADSALVGFVGVGPELPETSGKTGQLYTIYLVAGWWGRGLGHRLHTAGLDALAAAGFTEAVLWVLDSNTRAIAFYDREGWRPDGRSQVETLGSAVLSELRMSRPLAPARDGR